MKRLFLVSLLVASVFAAVASELVRMPYVLPSSQQKHLTGCDTIYTMPTTHAEFPGGMDALYDYYFKNLPKGYDMVDNMSANIILLKFFIDDNGKVADVKVLKSFNPDYTAQVLSLTDSLPAFTPAQFDGRNVCACRIVKLYFK